MKSVWLRSFFSAAFRSLWAPPQILFNQKPPYLAAIHQHNALSPTVRCRARFLFITAKCHELSSDFSWMGSLLSQPKANRLIRSRATCCVCPRGRQRFNTGEWATIFLGQLMCIWLYTSAHTWMPCTVTDAHTDLGECTCYLVHARVPVVPVYLPCTHFFWLGSHS